MDSQRGGDTGPTCWELSSSDAVAVRAFLLVDVLEGLGGLWLLLFLLDFGAVS